MRTITTILATASLVMPTAAMAAPSQPSYTPLVTLSMVAGPQSQAALCAVGAAGATAAAESTVTTAQAAPVQGCVLPVSDAAPVPVQSQILPPARTGFSPLLIGIGAIGLGVLLFALLHKDNNEGPPNAGQPVSPA